MFDPQDEIEIKKRLSGMTHEVKIVLFVQTFGCEGCPETETLLKDLAALSDKLKLEIYNPQIDREKAAQYNVSQVPAVVLEGDRDYGIRFFGTPGGYEFAGVLEDILAIGVRDSGLSESSKQQIQALTEPLNLKVFVTPG